MTEHSATEEAGLYQVAQQQYLRLAATMHEVVMAIHTGTWSVDHGAHGAQSSPCPDEDGRLGHYFEYARSLHVLGESAEQLQARALAAFQAQQMSVTTSVFGIAGNQDGTRSRRADASMQEAEPTAESEHASESVAAEAAPAAQYNVLAAGRGIARAAVRVASRSGLVRVTARTECLPGSAAELNEMIFEDDSLDVWRRLPVTEGPSSRPKFHFPPGAAVYYHPDGTPIATPQSLH